MTEIAAPGLAVRSVSLEFGGIVALDAVSLEVSTREIIGVIGSNGSGKTSLINVISGYYRPTRGDVLWNGRVVSGLPPQELKRLGMSRVFQNLRLFRDMTVLENLELAMCTDLARVRGVARGTLEAMLWHRQSRIRREARAAALRLLEENDWMKLATIKCGDLSYGQAKILELLRAVALPPELLLLDEPTSGVAESDAEVLKTKIVAWRNRFGFTTVIIEHRLAWLFDLVDRVIVLDHGQTIAVGTPSEVIEDESVRRAYAGS